MLSSYQEFSLFCTSLVRVMIARARRLPPPEQAVTLGALPSFRLWEVPEQLAALKDVQSMAGYLARLEEEVSRTAASQ